MADYEFKVGDCVRFRPDQRVSLGPYYTTEELLVVEVRERMLRVQLPGGTRHWWFKRRFEPMGGPW